MLRALAILLLACGTCRAGSPPPYAPDAFSKDLASAVAGAVDALNAVQTTPVEAARAARLKGSIDQFGSAVATAAASGQGLASLTAAPLKALADVKGLDALYDAAAAGAAAARQERKRLGDDAQPYRSELEGWEKPKVEDEASKAKSKKKDLLKEVLGRLEAGDRSLKALESVLEDLAEARAAGKSQAAQAATAASELERSAAELSKTAVALQDAGAQAKAKVDGLAIPPESEARTRVYQKLDPLIEALRTASYHGDVIRNRSGTFSDRYAGALKALKSFEDLRKQAQDKQAETLYDLSSAKSALSSLK